MNDWNELLINCSLNTEAFNTIEFLFVSIFCFFPFFLDTSSVYFQWTAESMENIRQQIKQNQIRASQRWFKLILNQHLFGDLKKNCIRNGKKNIIIKNHILMSMTYKNVLKYWRRSSMFMRAIWLVITNCKIHVCTC